MAKCNYCGKEDITVDRNLFDGMCVNCTDKALNDEKISKKAEINNKKLKMKW